MTSRETSENSKNISKDADDQKEKIDLSIKINNYSFVFYFLFIALAAYLIIGSFTILPPFSYDFNTSEIYLNTTLFIILLVTDLLFLMLGMYFSWFWKGAKKPGEEESLTTEKPTESIDQEIIFTDEELIKIEEIENHGKENEI